MRLGILISGSGTTFLNLHNRILTGELNAEIVCLVSSNPNAGGLEHAARLGVPHWVVSLQNGDVQAFSTEIHRLLVQTGVDLVVLGGFLKPFLPQEPYLERCINIHPSLIPAFCGKGFYGMHVHRAVYARGCRVSGCTVHLVTEDYDAGPILLQRAVTLEDDDDPSSIQRKVFALECEALPEVIEWFRADRVRFENGRAWISAAN
ncbi:MAG: phosphoribosylglycinamide formyltransferase [Acidobacteria bacterium]|nr:phosphoribosylglycinamide formyltransferase [Acidobacteriota bacterium]MCB9396878.1 phosphoribosylglycinamide formyltransferase [Acidobacteriota bacterium]